MLIPSITYTIFGQAYVDFVCNSVLDNVYGVHIMLIHCGGRVSVAASLKKFPAPQTYLTKSARLPDVFAASKEDRISSHCLFLRELVVKSDPSFVEMNFLIFSELVSAM